MPSTISYDFGDVVLVPFPFTDQSGAKKRPAIVVSSATLHREGRDMVIIAVTTQPRPASSLEVTVTAWQQAGLLRPSVIKPVIATAERALVVKKLGQLQPPDLAALREALRRILE